MPVPVANGCTVGSSRQASSLKPKSRTTSSSNSFCGSIAKSWLWGSFPPRAGDLLDERRLVLLQVVEEAAHLLRLHPALVVVEHDVVRLVADLEAVDVALPQVEVLAQRRQERREVVPLARLDPDGVRERGGARHLRAQLRRHLARLLPVARRRPGSGSPRTSRTRAPRPSCAGRRAGCPISAEVNFWWAIRPIVASCSARSAAPPRRHHHLLVPAEQRTRLRQVRDLGEPSPQLVELRLAHERETYMSRGPCPRRQHSRERRSGRAGRARSPRTTPSLRRRTQTPVGAESDGVWSPARRPEPGLRQGLRMRPTIARFR